MRFKADEVLPPGFRLHWYQLQSVLGDGGFGITYLGRDTNLNQSVAIKEFFLRSVVCRGEDHKIVVKEGADREFFQWGLGRFLDEARLLARFRHPNIVRVISVFESLGTAYTVMELERGKSLGESISDGEFPQDAHVLDLCLPVMDGLEMVHDAGFIHRDIKPCNILMRSGMGPVLIDFGSARQLLCGHSGELTAIVSRGYAPFEQYEAGTEHRQGPWTDIYGLGATLYHAITGGAPVDALTRGMCLLNGDPDPFVPSAVSAPGRFSARLLNSVDRALAFKASDRPQSIAEWRSIFPNHTSLRSRSSQAVRTEALDKTANGESVAERLRLATRPVDSLRSTRGTSSNRESETVTIRTSATEHNTAVVGAGFRDLRILLVDDDRAARTLTKRVLSNLGAECIDTVESAGEALARLEDASCVPELLISDLEMPHMDGVQLLRHLARRHFRAPLLLIGDADERVLDGVRYLASAHGLNVLGSIRKPVTPERLARVISQMDTSVLRADEHEVGADDAVTDAMLRTGLADKALQVVYLPKVSVKDRELLGAEALVRWQSAQSKAIDALTLVRRLEALGLADAMTEQVLRNALLHTGQWRASGLPCGVSVNMFAALLGRLDLPEYLLGLAEEEGVAPRDITLEVDHMRMSSERDVPLEIMVRLRLLGVDLSLDNFGTGSSTLERLRFVPFTELKVDRSFVAAACEERTARVILESSVALARRLNIQVVAQGVENQQTWELIEQMGFDAAQGYYISPPLAGEDLASWSRDWCLGRQARIAQA